MWVSTLIFPFILPRGAGFAPPKPNRLGVPFPECNALSRSTEVVYNPQGYTLASFHGLPHSSKYHQAGKSSSYRMVSPRPSTQQGRILQHFCLLFPLFGLGKISEEPSHLQHCASYRPLKPMIRKQKESNLQRLISPFWGHNSLSAKTYSRRDNGALCF